MTELQKLTPEYLEIVNARRVGLTNWIEDSLKGVKNIVWEVGCGHGHFLTAYAEENPDVVCVGLDIEKDRIKRANKKKSRAKLTNLHFLHADAFDFMATLPDKITFSAVYVLFPDPWPKRRHHKNRIMQPEFIEAVSKKIMPKGRLYFRTDYKPYYDAAYNFVLLEKQLKVTEDPWPFDKETVFQLRSKGYNSINAIKK